MRLAKPSDAKAEAILYAILEGIHRWKMERPRTAMEIRLPGERVIAASATAIRLHEEGLRRSDHFDFNRFPDEGRDWGRLVIKVDDKSYGCVVPSSLYKFVHGVTDPENPRPLPRPAPAR